MDPGGHSRVRATPDLLSLSLGDYPVAGQAAVVIEKKMQFDSPLGAPELRPIKGRQTKIDDGSIQAIELVLETIRASGLASERQRSSSWPKTSSKSA